MSREFTPAEQAKFDEASASIGIEKLREYEAAQEDWRKVEQQLTEMRNRIPELHQYESLRFRAEEARKKADEIGSTAALFMVPLLRIMERGKGKKARKK